MLCRLLNHREIKLVSRSLLRFLDRSVTRAMGCFYDCFRVRDDDHRHRSRAPRIDRTNREAVASKNSLSSLFLSQEQEDSPCKDGKNSKHTIIQIEDELRQEAKFLKACGTIPETPIEIRKASQKLKSSPPCDKDTEPSKCHSWIPSSSIKNLQLDEHPDQSSTHTKLLMEGIGAGSLQQTPSSCISTAQNTGRISISSTEGSEDGSAVTSVKVPAIGHITASASSPLEVSNAKCRNKSVRFEFDHDASSSKSSFGSVSQTSNKYESPGVQSVSKPSPIPTPLKLSDEMQTPGTAFPANLENLAHGKTRIRSQYVYSVLNPVENLSQWNVIKEEDSKSYQISDDLTGAREQSEHTSLTPEVQAEKTSGARDMKVEASLSSWLKPPPSVHDDNQNIEGAYRKNPITPGDRPIIGMVAAHWNADESSSISPKWWDGNGIPNSTNKYKEDQKVCWHATPFEERLEKALSEESLISHRKHVSGKPIIFEENEESDTALSQLHSSVHSKSVVSC